MGHLNSKFPDWNNTKLMEKTTKACLYTRRYPNGRHRGINNPKIRLGRLE